MIHFIIGFITGEIAGAILLAAVQVGSRKEQDD